ncbi:MAG TPA: glycosyltransferase [Solirubrobacteraceae bacterium]|jgi:glycosyltransferase involved in cell wall biosynthesis|nr:glycosyltransferase [Solirubrobacteraceae bacterium]
MAAAQAVDVLIVSLGSTAGLRAADEELRGALERAGASAALAHASAPARRRTLMLTDLAWARAARAAARAELARRPARAVIYSSTTAALLWPRAGAIRFDATAAGNRPGRHGLWQRPLERRRLGQAPLLLPWSEGALSETPGLALGGVRVQVLPVPVETGREDAPAARDLAALTYAANPSKKGLDRVLAAWRSVRAERGAGGELIVAGASGSELRATGLLGGAEEGVRVVGALPREEYRALLRRARVFVCAPRREDYGIAQLEALAEGCLLVSTPAPGPYVALSIARALDPRLIDADLSRALRVALEDPAPDYAERARAALAPFTRARCDELVAEELLPRLLG